MDDPDEKNDRLAYLKFSLSGVTGAGVNSAVLKVYCNALPNGSPAPVKAYSVTDDSWTESGITWNNKPAAITLLDTQSIIATGAWYSFNVTSFVASEYNGDKTVSLALLDNTQAVKLAGFNSKENAANKPTLEVVMH